MLILEGVQAGLSWSLILKKREGYLQAFDGFDAHKIAHYDDRKVQELLANPEIVRNRLKIRAAIQNARAFLELQSQYGSFDAFLWRFVGGQPMQNCAGYLGHPFSKSMDLLIFLGAVAFTDQGMPEHFVCLHS